MAAYVIVEIEIRDPSRYDDYRRMATPTVAAHGGRFVVRGGRAERLEGTLPTFERAKEWWASPEYAPAKALRQEIARAELIVVEGA
jgi:uncharacterized protein (DUF1330 family)